MSQLLKIAVIGTGGMGRAHISALSRLRDRFEVVGLCDAREGAARAIRDEFKYESASTFSNYQSMFSKLLRLDAVVIALPHNEHAIVTQNALRFGINVLCEKPGSLSLSEFERIDNTVSQTGTTYALGFNKRYLHMVEKAESLINFGELGEIIQVVVNDEWRHRDLHDLFLQKGEPNWRATKKNMGRLGIGNDTTAHSLSLLTALTMHQPNEVMMVDHRENLPLYLKMQGADTFDVRLRFGERGRAVANTSWAINSGGEPLFRVHGTHGDLIGRITSNENGEEQEELTIRRFVAGAKKDDKEILVWPKGLDLQRQLINFGHCVQYKLEPRNGITHARAFADLRERVFNFNNSSAIPDAEIDEPKYVLSTH